MLPHICRRSSLCLAAEVKVAVAAAAESRQSCPTLCDPTDSSPPGSPVPGILQARTVERVAISFSSAWKWKVKVKSLSLVRLLATPWTAAYPAPLSMGFSRQEHWSGVPKVASPSFWLPLHFRRSSVNGSGMVSSLCTVKVVVFLKNPLSFQIFTTVI